MLAGATIKIESLVESELPPLPGSALRVTNLAQDINASSRSLADAIGLDPALSARILRAANSPLYARERAATSLPSAVNTLGNHTIHMFVMVYVASDAFNRRNGKGTATERALWEHSIAVAMAARELCLALGLRGGEEMFLCGLLHDIGKLLLLRHNPELYASISADPNPLQGENKLYGYTHTQVGAFAVRRWGLPEEIGYAIHHHHEPSEAPEGVLMARIIDVADILANNANIGLRRDMPTNLTLSESVIALRLDPEQLESVWQKTEAKLHDALSLFT